MRRDLRKTEFDGRAALVTKVHHPQKGEVAICLGAKFNSRAMVWQMVFQNTRTREEFIVNGGGDIKWIVDKNEIKK